MKRRFNYEQTQELANSYGYKLCVDKSEFLNFGDKMLYQCLKCGEVKYDTIKQIEKRKGNCNNCHNKRKFEEGKAILENKGYSIITTHYENSEKQVVTITCNNGHVYNTNWHCVFKGKGCRKCADIANGEKQRTTLEEVRHIIEKEGYIMVDNHYINNQTPINMICPHDRPYKATLGNFKNGKRCSCISYSKGEKEVEYILNKLDIRFTMQKRFAECKYRNTLPFDFYLEDLGVAIEHDGIQHFEVRFGGDEKTLAETQLRDKIKTEFCKDNGIKLIRIPYWEFEQIENILKKELHTYIIDGKPSTTIP